jgi:hypothetical protein
MRPKKRVPLYYWPLWLVLLAAGLFVFYVVFTPVWIAIRTVAWLAEGRRGRLPRHDPT